MQTLNIDGTPRGGGSELIKDSSTSGFKADVIDASHDALVLVDFWAPWCGPCKQLTPVLESVVKAAGGTVRLVKLDIDKHPSIPGQMGVQSIPAVFAFKDGRPVDGFMGAVPESQVKEFIARHVQAPEVSQAEADVEAAEQALLIGDVKTAAQIFAHIIQSDKENIPAIAGLAKCYIETGDLDEAEQTLDQADTSKKPSGEIDAVRAALEIARKSHEAGDEGDLRAKINDNPNDFQARCDLAIVLNAAGNREGAAEQLLAVVSANRNWNEGAARAQLLQFFEAWGNDDPATISGRQKLSLLLFS